MMFLVYIACALPFLAAIAEIIVTWRFDETLMGTGYDLDPEGGEA
nr:hypothetical protein [Amylibacter sp.]